MALMKCDRSTEAPLLTRGGPPKIGLVINHVVAHIESNGCGNSAECSVPGLGGSGGKGGWGGVVKNKRGEDGGERQAR